MKDETELSPTELKTIVNCPFCGTIPEYIEEDDTLIDFDPDYHSELVGDDEIDSLLEGEEIEVTGYAVYCWKCKIKGPEKVFREEAIAAWNTRHSSDRNSSLIRASSFP